MLKITVTLHTGDVSFSPTGPFRRLGALFYDGLLLLGILFISTAILLPFRGGRPFLAGDLAYGTYLFAVVFVFFGWFWTRGGQTLGMQAWNIRLISADGGPVSWKQSALRFLPVLLCLGVFKLGASLWPGAANGFGLLSLGLFGLGFLWALLDRDRRCWHDLIANTRMASLNDTHAVRRIRSASDNPPGGGE